MERGGACVDARHLEELASRNVDTTRELFAYSSATVALPPGAPSTVRPTRTFAAGADPEQLLGGPGAEDEASDGGAANGRPPDDGEDGTA